jgi:hypothetical protein
MRKVLVLLALFMLVLPLGACKKKAEEEAVAPPSPGVFIPPGEPQIVVPDTVKGKWSAVKLRIQDKQTGKSEEVVVNLGGQYQIPNSELKVVVEEFLPDFKMEGTVITSSSNEPNNPAVRVMIYEGQKEIFRGWLYSKFPAIHPFQHERFAITLKEGIKKG